MGRVAPFIKAVGGHEDSVIIAYGPKSMIEEPMGCFRKRDTVRRVIAAALLELVDVGGVEDRLAIQRDHPVTSESTCVVVGR